MSNMYLTKILGVNPGTCEVKAVKFKKNHFVKSYRQNMVYGYFKINIEIIGHIFIKKYSITGNFCGFWLKRGHLIFADFFSCRLKISAPKKNCLYYRKQQLKRCYNKQLVHITVILRSKNIFSSLESFQRLHLLNTHLVNFKFI